ncbi:MAG: FAD-dependent oxidoreductase [Syntrophorhabdaceae bacterium]
MANKQFFEPAGQHRSYWIDTAPETNYPAFQGAAVFDVVIAGGGIAGIMTAKLLKLSGAKVAIIEAYRIATRVTGHTTAKLTSLHGLIYDHLLRSMGEEKARMYAEANQSAIGFVRDMVSTGGIQCDFHNEAAYTFTESDAEKEAIDREVEAARKLGLPAEFISSEIAVPFSIKAAVRFDDQAYFHPRKFLLKIAETIPGDGSAIFEMTRVIKYEDGHPCVVHTNRGDITAGAVVIANNFPPGKEGLYFAKMEPKRSYLLAAEIDGEFPAGMFYQAEEPNHTARIHVDDAGKRLVLVGGEAHKPGHEADTVSRYRKVEEYARTQLKIQSIAYRWSTQDNRTIDRVPYIGPISQGSKRIFVATGFKKWGMTHGIVAGRILSDLISGRTNPWAPVFDPRRHMSIRGVDDLILMNLDSGKHLFSGPVSKLTAKSIDKFKVGEGGIAKMGNENVAAFKNAQSEVFAVSPNCPHMGCVLTWNNGEESWDCPCHGSRFDCRGTLIHGPATQDLEKK